MSLNRRKFLMTSSLAVAAGALRHVPAFAQAPAPPPQTKFEELRRGIGVFHGQGGTIGWLVSPDGVVVVDSQFPATAQACLDGLKQRSSRAIDVLINTHHHGDHTAGNKTFRAAVKTIVAHAKVPELQKAAAQKAGNEADQAYADKTFADAWKMTVGAEIVSAKHYGPGHTGGDAVIFFENANIVHMGDLMFNRLHPFVDRPAGASIANWIKTLEKVAAEQGADTTYVFGHGKPDLGVVGKRADLLVFRDYFTAVLEHVRKGMKAGQSREEIAKTEALPGFTDVISPSPRLSLAGVLGVAYEELTAT